jgi:hypothetical protein
VDDVGLGVGQAALEDASEDAALVVGDDDVANGTLGVNPRGGDVERGVPLAAFVERLAAEVSVAEVATLA